MSPTNPFERPEVRSRRGGPVKEPLSRERIVEEGLMLLAKDGLEAMSLRKVAAALETGPASLYAYVGDHAGLQALVLDRALAEVDLGGSRRQGWKERLKAVLRSYLTVLLEKRGLAHLAMATPAVGPNTMRILDTILGLLAEGGLDWATAAWGVDLLLLYATGIATEQSHGHDPAGGGSPIATAIAGVSPADYPNVSAARAELLGGEGSERFSWAVDVLLEGLRHSPPPGRRSSSRSKARR